MKFVNPKAQNSLCLCQIPAPRPMPPELTQAARLLTDFAADSPDLGCYVQNDNVMGGRSKGGFKLDEPALDPSQITEFGLYI